MSNLQNDKILNHIEIDTNIEYSMRFFFLDFELYNVFSYILAHYKETTLLFKNVVLIN